MGYRGQFLCTFIIVLYATYINMYANLNVGLHAYVLTYTSVDKVDITYANAACSMQIHADMYEYA